MPFAVGSCRKRVDARRPTRCKRKTIWLKSAMPIECACRDKRGREKKRIRHATKRRPTRSESANSIPRRKSRNPAEARSPARAVGSLDSRFGVAAARQPDVDGQRFPLPARGRHQNPVHRGPSEMSTSCPSQGDGLRHLHRSLLAAQAVSTSR